MKAACQRPFGKGRSSREHRPYRSFASRLGKALALARADLELSLSLPGDAHRPYRPPFAPGTEKTNPQPPRATSAPITMRTPDAGRSRRVPRAQSTMPRDKFVD